jgi:hypothetical protein
LGCLSSAPAQQTRKPAKADEAKAIAAGINAPVEKDPRVQSDGKPWGINKATVSDPTRPRVLLIGDSILNGYANTVIKRLAGKAYVDYWVNDLYTLSVNRLDLKQNDFHWKDAARKIQGDAVAGCVLKLLPATRAAASTKDEPAKQ